MDDFKFDNLEDQKRDRDIEGRIGISLKIRESFYLLVRAATDANTAWRDKAPKVLKEIRRLDNAGAPQDQQRGLLAGLYADTLLFGWHGGLNDDGSFKPGGPTIKGSPIDYTAAAGKAYLIQADDGLDAIEKHCFDTAWFRAARAEKIVENVGNG